MIAFIGGRMVFALNSSNVFSYLSEQNLLNTGQKYLEKVELIEAKNFNLLVTFSDQSKLLVKQERYQKQGKVIGEFFGEWKSREFLRQLPEFCLLKNYVNRVIHFDPDNSILVFHYLEDYQDLTNLYQTSNFPIKIAKDIGYFSAFLHRETFQNEEYKNFWTADKNPLSPEPLKFLIEGLERITPEIFSVVPADGLKFFVLYQKYDSLGQAISELKQAFQPSCLTHSDLKINNILLSKNWQNLDQKLLCVIDWERASWGDPAFDLGMLISSYLQLWLNSLVISRTLSIETSLKLATIPLENIQPSLKILIQNYLEIFPEILEIRPDFIERVIQFAGLGLIQQIQAMIQYHKVFGNLGIAMLQVAKTLLCRPQASITTVFGANIVF
ncbi:aminoglycoside phosphotransferase family protein [Microcystis sp. LSC13-02]|jgi:5-methylthioribose kinase|uniref:aminoglycoside phosphotransferase family protein n=1 Tax=Microcystis sp. LSC13-02 TaxID=1895004 RepID=UPI00257FAF26|nr:aminoglycoside phosphotransferase family protein [Microcystis sp. LSC13-02]